MLHKNETVGDYTLVNFLGKGQFGEVWLAEKQLQFSNKKIRHALKFLLSRTGEELDVREVQEEIDTWIEAGGHPNVISVLDMLVYHGHVVIVSEYADGGSLKQWLRSNGGKAPSEEKATELMLGILRGIEHLHSRNVVHRDLKPENILLQNDFPRITDFGISRIVSGNATTTQAIGSPSYMSPESFMGNKSPQTDIWSAGVIFYEMLSGNLPFDGENIFYLKESIEKESALPLPEFVSPELREIVNQGLQKDKSRRLQTAREMRLALETASYSLRKTSNEATISYDSPIAETHRIHDPAIVKPADQTQAAPTQLGINLKNKVEPGKTQAAGFVNTNPDQIQNQTNPPQNEEILEPLNISFPIPTSRKESGSNAKWWVAGIAASVLIGLSIGIFFAFSSGNSTQKNTNVSEANNVVNKTAVPVAPEGMAYIPGGEFTMGRDDGKSEAEKPAHKVSVNPFFMDVTEVNNEQYNEFVKANNYKTPVSWKDGVYDSKLAKFPVVGVNWEDAGAYAKWAKKRLPTEEEWEFAARGTGNFIYPWGNEWKQENANVGSQALAEAGKFKGKSPFGLLDMVGNAWEWTASDFTAYPNGKLPEAFAGKSNLKTIRGGSFEATKDFATTTYRIGWAATGADSYMRTGFRCIKDISR